jgi:Domain of unknown function (DUF1840)
MLYKFKSDAGGDVIMLEETGRQILVWMDKSSDAKGILLPDQMQGAKEAIEAGLAREEQIQKELAQAQEDAPVSKAGERVSLRARAWPLVTLIEKSQKAKVPITWGV